PQAGYGVARDRLGKFPQADLRESSAARGGPRKHDAHLRCKAGNRGVRRRDALQREGARRPRLAQAAMPSAIRHGHSQRSAAAAKAARIPYRRTKDLMPDATWAAAGIGRHQLEVNEWCLELGGHVRTGLEANIKFDKTRLARSNAELVARVADLCAAKGR